MLTRRTTRSTSRSAEPGAAAELQLLPQPTVTRRGRGAAASSAAASAAAAGDDDKFGVSITSSSVSTSSSAVKRTSATSRSARSTRLARALDFHNEDTVNESEMDGNDSEAEMTDEERVMSRLLPEREAKMYKIDACDSHVVIDHAPYSPRRRMPSPAKIGTPGPSVLTPAISTASGASTPAGSKAASAASGVSGAATTAQSSAQQQVVVVKPAPACAKCFTTINFAAKKLFLPLLLLALVAAFSIYVAPIFINHLTESRAYQVPKEIDAESFNRIASAATAHVKSQITDKVLSAYAKVVELRETDTNLRMLVEKSVQNAIRDFKLNLEQFRKSLPTEYYTRSEADAKFLTQAKVESYLTDVWVKSLLSPNSSFLKSVTDNVNTAIVDSVTSAATAAANNAAAARAEAALKTAALEAQKAAKTVAAEVAKSVYLEETAKFATAKDGASSDAERVAKTVEAKLEALKQQAVNAASAAAETKIQAELAAAESKALKDYEARATQLAEQIRSMTTEKLGSVTMDIYKTLEEHSANTTRYVDSLSARLDNYYEQLKKLGEKVAATESAAQKVDADAKKEFENITKKIELLARDLSLSKSELNDAIKKAVSDASNSRDQFEKIRSETLAEITLVREMFRDMNNTKVTAATDIGAFAQRFNALEAKLNEALNASSKVDPKVAELQAAFESTRAYGEQIASLSAQVEKLSVDVSSLKQAQASVESRVDEIERKLGNMSIQAAKTTAPSFDMSHVIEYVDKRLEIYDADRTAKVDFALKSAGGTVVAHSPTFERVSEHNSWFDYFRSCYVPKKQPDIVLESNGRVGECWPMSGTNGYVLIRLSAPIHVTAITLHHVSKTIATNVETAPRKFRVYGVTDADAAAAARAGANPPSTAIPGTLLGTFEYNVDAKFALQEFPIKQVDTKKKPVSFVKFEVLSNHGNSDFTCLYRIRVHGIPANQHE